MPELPGVNPAKVLKTVLVVGSATCSVLVNLADHEVIELSAETKRTITKLGASLGMSLLVHKALTKLEGSK